MFPSVFPSSKATAKAVICSHGRGQEDFHFLSERVSHPIEQEEGMNGWTDGWINTRLVREGGHALIYCNMV